MIIITLWNVFNNEWFCQNYGMVLYFLRSFHHSNALANIVQNSHISMQRVQSRWFYWYLFCLWNCFFFNLDSNCYKWRIAQCGYYVWPMQIATSIWQSFLKYDWCKKNCKLWFSKHHSYFIKDCQMLLTAKEDKM